MYQWVLVAMLEEVMAISDLRLVALLKRLEVTLACIRGRVIFPGTRQILPFTKASSQGRHELLNRLSEGLIIRLSISGSLKPTAGSFSASRQYDVQREYRQLGSTDPL